MASTDFLLPRQSWADKSGNLVCHLSGKVYEAFQLELLLLYIYIRVYPFKIFNNNNNKILGNEKHNMWVPNIIYVENVLFCQTDSAESIPALSSLNES